MVSDRATVIATAIKRIIAGIRDPIELQHQIERLLRDELADLERQIAADRGDAS
jgi:hypothetical protein